MAPYAVLKIAVANQKPNPQSNGPGLRRSSTFLISGEIQRLLNSRQRALSLSEQTFLFETRKLGLLETLVLGNGRFARL